MTTDLYLNTLPQRISKLSNPESEKFLKQWTYNYTTNTKSINQYSPEISLLLSKYSIHIIYLLSKYHSNLSQKISLFYKNNKLDPQKAEKTSKNFNPDKYCIYEDYTNFVAKVFESAEGEYKEKLLNIKEFSNYLQIIAVYKLLVDMMDLVEIWKEKDEDLQKFQNLCKFRVIQIIRAKKDYDLNKDEYDKEFNELNKQVEKEKLLESQMQQNQNFSLKKSNTISSNNNNNFNNQYNLNPYQNNFNNNNNLNYNNYNQTQRNINNSPNNPFSGNCNPYGLPKVDYSQSSNVKKMPKRKTNYSKNDREVQEINQMYNNYNPGEYDKVSNNKNTIEEVLKNFQYQGSKEVNITNFPIGYKSADYYAIRLHIKSILIPRIISQLKKNENEEAYKNSKLLLFYLSKMNTK